MTDDIEVLVHISTSATRQNDELFRSVASAYTEFKPHRTHRDQRVQRQVKAWQAVEPQSHASSRRPGGSPLPNVIEALVPEASKDSYGSFPSNVSSDNCYPGVDSVPGNTVRPVSRLAQLDRSYLSWRKHASPKLSFKQGQEKLRSSSEGLEDADTGFIEDSQSALEAIQSQLRDTWSMTSEDSSVDGLRDETDGGRDEVPSLVGVPAEGPSSRLAEDLSLPAFMNGSVSHDANVSSSNPAAGPTESTSRFSEAHPDGAPSQLDFSKLPIDAVPPPPAISVASPVVLPSQITRHLEAIKTNNPGRFKPVKIRRSLESDERGYWRIDCNRWHPSMQQEFWSSLCEHVCSGRIGWGTTLHREPNSAHGLGLVRLYCWGEVVEHMWLLMWLCSKGNVSNLGSQWIDADVIAVVEMN